MKPKVGLLTFAEQREEFYVKRKHIVEEESRNVIDALRGRFECVSPNLIRSKNELVSAIEKVREESIDCLVVSLPVWSAPNLPVMGVRLLELPTILYSNNRLDSSSQVAILATGGALDQIGFPHQRVVGSIDDAQTLGAIDAFCTAASAMNRLKGTTYGCFGGRSLGICTATADLAQWQSLFGIDIEHIDQMEIVRRAGSVQEKEIQQHMEWIEKNFGAIEYDGTFLTPEKLRSQIRDYLATKRIAEEMGLDFIGIKCQTEMSDHHVLQCLNQMLLNDPYDAEGPKEPVVSSCEADHDAALSMQILKFMSGGSPTLFLDIRHVAESQIIGANCGSMPSWFANYSKNPSHNTKEVHLIPPAFGKAGGCAVQFVAGSGPVTLARLCRRKGNYWMAILKGSINRKRREELKKTTWAFPHAFIQADFDHKEFLGTYGSNHIHGARGDCVNELVQFCKLLSLDYIVYSR